MTHSRANKSTHSRGQHQPGPAATASLLHDIEALDNGTHTNPFAVLGLHRSRGKTELRVFLPGAKTVTAHSPRQSTEVPLKEIRDGFFMGDGDGLDSDYDLHICWPGAEQITKDPYAFGPLLGELDLYLIAEGRHGNLSDCLGAQVMCIQGATGVRFAVWAPNARRVSVVGDFNGWDGRRHIMRLRHEAGIWELFIPGLTPGARYQFELLGPEGHLLPLKSDPIARQTEMPPSTTSMVADNAPFVWNDLLWMQQRAASQSVTAPISIYEVHMGSWQPAGDHEGCVWDNAGARLIEYVRHMGFTHIELMPIMEHPFGGSWGYQPLGMFAPTARYGSPADFARFVDRCHQAGIGVILDWVPAHFPNDSHGLMRFDGTALYEYSDPREGLHPDWNTIIYNLGRNEVRNFMINSALEWLRRYHVDGLRVDAVASMLYRDYSREPGEWIPNRLGGRENLETVEFLRELSTDIEKQCPGTLLIAEESTAWPGVTAPPGDGGLGFHYKWNMGWMHDTLQYMSYDPIHRRHHHHDMTFGMIYAYSENFILPLSHDEVVHGKNSLVNKMPGDRWQRFANLRAYLGFMWTHPGKKLIFMGIELGQEREWNHDAYLDWEGLSDPLKRGVQELMRDLNGLYRELPALHRSDCDPAGFSWLIGDDDDNSVFAFLRKDANHIVLGVVNMTPVIRRGYRVGVPAQGVWTERLNTDASIYGGTNTGNGGACPSEDRAAHGHPQSLRLTLPPLATLIFQYEGQMP